ncbi:unnamed protein product [Arabis nemorensis]|uniref:Uncharacterized protein n=1 Tax=Arabis nemorensis TaxID=586526 RepID=A0A565CBR9_9BRAS|nr:unnamed protein product [Arabis nemorensis]
MFAGSCVQAIEIDMSRNQKRSFQKALEQEYGCQLCIGPCTTRGEMFLWL